MPQKALSHPALSFLEAKTLTEEPGFKYMWKKNPSPACAWSYPACHLPGEKQQWLCKQKAVFSGLLKSPALPARLSIKGKRRHFRSFPKKARSLLSSRASLGLFISADFPARLAELGRPGGTLAESPCWVTHAHTSWERGLASTYCTFQLWFMPPQESK